MRSSRKLMTSPALLPLIRLPCRRCQCQFHAVIKQDFCVENVLPRISTFVAACSSIERSESVNNSQFGGHRIISHLSGRCITLSQSLLDLLYLTKYLLTSSTFRETHFWYIVPDEVQQASLLNQYMDLLPPCERNNVSSIKEIKLRKRALLARVLVRSTLARYTNPQLDPRLLKFRKNNFGKPEVDWQHFQSWDSPSVHFNLSHTPSLIALGIAVDIPIGIDVEEKQRKLRNNILLFARRYFSPHEVYYLQAFSDPEIQRQEFIKLWTLKEAYVKAIGRGISAAPLSSFAICFRSGKHMQNAGETSSDTYQIILEASDDAQNLTTDWQFALFELASSHYASICLKKDDNLQDNESSLLRLKVWKTLPFVDDMFVSGTDAVVSIGGLL